jgi:hypothetical protein
MKPPHREEQPKAPEPGAERKPKRFRIVKLEERIAPSLKGGNGTNHGCYTGPGITCNCYSGSHCNY